MFFVLVITIQFNKQRARPDAAQDDLLSTFVSPQTTANEIGFRFVFERKFSLEMNFIKKIFLVMKLIQKMFLKNKQI